MTGRIQTIQATGKDWKLLIGLGVLALIPGALALITLWAAPDALSREENQVVTGVAIVGLLVGSVLFLIGKLGAWWNHG